MERRNENLIKSISLKAKSISEVRLHLVILDRCSNTLKNGILALCLFVFPFLSLGQPTVGIDTSFNAVTGANNGVKAIAVQPDGKIIIGGVFTTFNYLSKNRIARLNTNGTLDSSFTSSTGFNGMRPDVNSIVMQPDGKILIGGEFTSYNGISTGTIVRLHSNGERDPTFIPNLRSYGAIHSIALLANGKILIGGGNVTYINARGKHLAMLNSDGSLDSSFTSSLTFDNHIYSVLVQPDGKILLSGAFTTVNDVLRNCITRLNADGSLDLNFNPEYEVNGQIYAMALQADGKILIGGGFNSFGNPFTRLNSDGSSDGSFNTGLGVNSTVMTIAPQANGKIIIGGFFTSYNGVSRNYIARLNANGGLDTSFNLQPSINSIVNCLVFQPDGKLLVGGYFVNFIEAFNRGITRIFNSDIISNALPETINDNLQVYPNPFANTFRLSNKGIAQLLDVHGRVILSQSVEADEELKVGNLPKGMYLLRLQGEGGRMYLRKVVRE